MKWYTVRRNGKRVTDITSLANAKQIADEKKQDAKHDALTVTDDQGKTLYKAK